MEELNQVQDELVVNSDDENLFGDFEETEDTPVEESVEVTEEPVPFELKVQYNGEEKNLTEDEARTFAQKGMNYDRIYEPLERLARMNGMQVGEYINQLNTTQIQYEISKEVDNLRNDPKYENVSDEILEEIASSRVNDRVNLQDKNYEEQIRGQADAQQQQVQKEVDKFLEEYPEFKNKGPDSLDPQVYEFVKQGYTLLEAYNKWNRQVNKPQEEAKAKISKLNEENKRKSLGSTTNAGSVDYDDFLSGFLKN